MQTLKFKEFFTEQNTVGKHNDYATAAFTTDQTPRLPETGDPLTRLIVPTVSRTSKIEFVDRNSKQHGKLITVLLADKTKLYFNWDEFRRIKGAEPMRGRMMTVEFQRHPSDNSGQPSQINGVTCY